MAIVTIVYRQMLKTFKVFQFGMVFCKIFLHCTIIHWTCLKYHNLFGLKKQLVCVRARYSVRNVLGHYFWWFSGQCGFAGQSKASDEMSHYALYKKLMYRYRNIPIKLLTIGMIESWNDISHPWDAIHRMCLSLWLVLGRGRECSIAKTVCYCCWRLMKRNKIPRFRLSHILGMNWYYMCLVCAWHRTCFSVCSHASGDAKMMWNIIDVVRHAH